MSVRDRYGGVSAPAYGMMLVLGFGGLLLEGATNGRSWGVLAATGTITFD